MTFLRIMEAITNGSFMQINYTGTVVRYKPGLIAGGSHTFKIPKSRGMGYFLEPLLLLGPFGKKPLTIKLTEGSTSVPGSRSQTTTTTTTTAETESSSGSGSGSGSPFATGDIGVDMVRTALFKILEKFGIDRSELRIERRGSVPGGGGEVVLHMPHQVLQPQTVHATSAPLIDRIRGVAYSTKVSPASVNRIVEAARNILRPTGCETHIYTVATTGRESGNSPGFGCCIVAETKSGWVYGVESVARPGDLPEDIGELTASKLLEELSIGGAVPRGSSLQLATILMVLGKEDIGRLVIGRGAIDVKYVRLLRTLKEFFGVEAVIKEDPFDPESKEITCLIKGTGFINSNKKVV